MCPTLFLVTKITFSYFRSALEPEILNSQIRTGNCCRVVGIMHPGFVRFLRENMYLEQKRSYTSKMCPTRIVHGRVNYRGDSIRASC